MNKKIEFWKEEFEFLEDDDRLVYLIDMAKKATTLPDEMLTPDRLVKGCMSQIWVEVGLKGDLVKVYFSSDALITRGITNVVADCFSDIPLDEAKKMTKSDIEELGIAELLTSQRRNGLSNLIATIITKISHLN